MGALILPQVTFEASYGTDAWATPAYTDETTRVRSFRCRRGKSHELQRFSPGTFDAVLLDNDRRFDPLYTSGPLYGQLLPGVRCRMRAAWPVNLVPYNTASIETDASGWQVWLNCTIARTLAQAADGVASLQLTSVAAGPMYPATVIAIPVEAGRLYTYASAMRAAAVPQATRFYVNYLDRLGAFLGQSIFNSADVVGAWTTTVGTAVAPANAAFVHLYPSTQNTAGAGEVHYVDKVFMGQGDYSAAPWPTTYPIFVMFSEKWQRQRAGPVRADTQLNGAGQFKDFNIKDALGTSYEDVVDLYAPISWYRFDEEAIATSVADSGTSGIAGAVLGSISTEAGPITEEASTGITFGRQGAVSTGSFNVAQYQPFTMALWIKATPPDTDVVVASRENVGAGTYQWRLMLRGPTGVLGSLQLDLGVSGGGATTQGFTFGGIADGKWHYVVFVHRAVGTGGTWLVFVDGVSAGGGVSGNYTVNVAFNDYFGADRGVYTFAGSLKDVQLYSSEFAAADVVAHYGAARGNWGWPNGQRSDLRLGKLLDLAGWPVGDRSLSVGQSTLQPAQPVGGQKLLGLMQKVEESEDGFLYEGSDGLVVFQDRYALSRTPNLVPLASFGVGGTYPYQSPPEQWVDDRDVYGEATAQSFGLTTQRAKDDASLDKYGHRTLAATDLLLRTKADNLNYANSRLSTYKAPAPRFGPIRINPQSDPANLFPIVLALNIGHRLVVDGIEVNVLQVEHNVDFDKGSWVTEVVVVPSAFQDWWALGSSALGVDTRLAW